MQSSLTPTSQALLYLSTLATLLPRAQHQTQQCNTITIVAAAAAAAAATGEAATGEPRVAAVAAVAAPN